jgi:hypothetical protein
MKVKIDTKEMFHVMNIEETEISANMSAQLMEIIQKTQEKDCKSIILNFHHVQHANTDLLKTLEQIHTMQYDQKKSFVICELSATVKNQLQLNEDSEAPHTTPTESEAWDIVQMEEIERELGLEY